MKFAIRFLLKILALLILIVCVYFIFALVLSLIPANPDFKNSADGIQVFVRSNGVHTDVVLPVKSDYITWIEKIPYSSVQHADSSFQWIGFGWGNREFYIETKEWKDLKTSTALRAGLGIGTAALHVEFIRKPLKNDRWIELNLEKENFEKLSAYIHNFFRTDESGNFIQIPDAHYYSNDAFFEAHGRFTSITTCNTWTGKGLRAAGIRTGIWTPFEKSVMWQLNQISNRADF